MEPPSYDDHDRSEAPEVSSGLPAYTRRPTPPQVDREPKKFSYEIKNQAGPWAKLVIQGDARLSKTIPTVIEGSNLVGSVTLTLQKEETMQSVFILVSRYSSNRTLDAGILLFG